MITETVNYAKKKLSRRKWQDLWQGTNRDRLLLFSIIAGVYLVNKATEELLPERYLAALPSHVSLTILAIIVAGMLLHTVFIFFAQFHHRHNPRTLNSLYQPTIDIFVSAHNEEKVIRATIEQLLTLSYPKLHIYMINDRSTDATWDEMHCVKTSYGEMNSTETATATIVKINKKLSYINRKLKAFPGKAAALNDALAASQSEVICVLDADARITDDFLTNIVRYLGDPSVAAVQAQKVISNPEKNFLTYCQCNEYAMDTYLQMGRDSVRGATELRGNGELVKREALEHIGGWNEDTLTDDLDLSTCLHVNGWDIRFSPENIVLEEGVPTWDGFIKQRRRWAEGSMRRYLTYLLQIFTPGNLSLNQIFDTLFFFGQFCLPLWLTIDMSYELYRLAIHQSNCLSFYMLITMAISVITFITQFNGLRIYKHQKFGEAVVNTLITNIYLCSTWLVVILITYRKILFSRSVGKWTRTEHGT